MPRLTIDNRKVEVSAGSTILEAARKLSIEIPTLCYRKGCEPSTSCLVCVVKIDNNAERLVPSCATVVVDGMRVESETPQIHQARKAALELLLSDHLGDCLAPCHSICPAQMNIPVMIRQIAAGDLRSAIITVKRDIALPAVLGRICPAPCEKGCRRADYDNPVAICLLKRYVADVDLASERPYLPECKENKGRKIAIVGAGPTGLAGAYYLRQEGYSCTIFDEHEKAGGMLQYGVAEEQLPRNILNAEVALIEELGVNFQLAGKIGRDISIPELRRQYDAVLIAVGRLKADEANMLGLETGKNGIKINSKTYQTSLPGVFAGGDAVRPQRLSVRAVADGKAAAVAITQYLSNLAVTGPHKPFTTHIGGLQQNEIDTFMVGAGKAPRTELLSDAKDGLTEDDARKEALRCLHCDCRKADACKLRKYAEIYHAKPNRYKAQRRVFEQQLHHPKIIYEPGKCIDCGLCLQIAAAAGEKPGLTFIGRGFDVRVAVPFDETLAEGLRIAGPDCVKACPTGALAFKK